MSQSEAQEATGAASRGHLELSTMMKRGRSWSGRERHCAFLNLGAERPRFANISALSGIDFPDDGRAVCLADWDHDGDLDLWISNRTAPQLRLMRNEASNGNRFLALKLTATAGNRDAIGARVRVTARSPNSDPRSSIRTVRAGDGYLAQSSKWLVFGLGAADSASVSIRWPGGAVQEIPALSTGAHYMVTEGAEPRPWKRPSRASALAPSEPQLPDPIASARIPFVTLLRFPTMDYQPFHGARRVVRATKGQALLLNLWASWCAPCLTELKELDARREELAAAGVEVLALSVDGLGDAEGSRANASKVAASLELGIPTGWADDDILTYLQRLHVRLTPMEMELVVPMSLLIDAGGRVAVWYRGGVTPDQLIADLDHSKLGRAARFAGSTGLGGVALEASHPQIAAAADQHELSQRFQFAQDLWSAGRLDDAAVQFRDTIAVAPDFVEARNNLGLVYARQGRHPEAIEIYRKALELDGDAATVHLNLGLSLEFFGTGADAEPAYLRALELDPELPKAHDALGMFYAKRNEFLAARDQFRRETEVNPNYAEGHNHLGLIHLSLDDAAGALAPLQRAIELDPKHTDALNNLAVAHRRLGDLAAARDAARRAVAVDARFVPALVNLGLINIELGKLDEAESAFLRLQALQPGSEAARLQLQRIRALRQGG